MTIIQKMPKIPIWSLNHFQNVWILFMNHAVLKYGGLSISFLIQSPVKPKLAAEFYWVIIEPELAFWEISALCISQMVLQQHPTLYAFRVCAAMQGAHTTGNTQRSLGKGEDYRTTGKTPLLLGCGHVGSSLRNCMHI